MAEFKWHKMADEEPTDERGKYLLLGKRGAMYLANGFHTWEHSERINFCPYCGADLRRESD